MPTPTRSRISFLRKAPFSLGLACLLALYVPGSNELRAFDLDFLQDEGGLQNNDNYFRCNLSYLSSTNCGGGWGGDTDLSDSHIDGTPMMQELISVGGVKYWHIVLGSRNRLSRPRPATRTA